MSGQRHSPALCLGKRTPVPIVQEDGWTPDSVWTQRLEEKSFAPAGDRTPIARMSSSLVRHYTDWDIPAPRIPSTLQYYTQISINLGIFTVIICKSTLKMEATAFPETLVITYMSTRRCNPDRILNFRCHDNEISYEKCLEICSVYSD
jgi:hypothetical protein